MDILGITGVASITVICYLAAEAAKASAINNKWLPVICGVLGAALGIVAMFVMPVYPANDIISAAAIGVVSGLSATGVNQIFKQLGGGKSE